MPESRADRVVVVGAGAGGLAAAIRLARAGVDVRLIDAAEGPGGKLSTLAVDGAAIDAGPTVFTMRWVFDELFADAGDRLEDRLTLHPLATLARHAWRDGSRLDLHADPARSLDAIGAFAGPDEARQFEAFRVQARAVHDTLVDTYLRAPRPAFAGMVRELGPRGLATLASLGPFATLAGHLSRRFRDPRLRQLFARYATYCGASPWSAPATLVLIAQVEMDGVWRVEGGMAALARAIANLAARSGVTMRWRTRCARIIVERGQVRGVELADGERIDADAVVFNGDVGALDRGLLGPAVRRAVPDRRGAERSMSAVTWAMHARPAGFPLSHHTVFFDDDYASEFEDVFSRRRLPRRGTVYVCAQDRDDGDHAVDGARERLLCLVNAPAVGDAGAPTDEEIDACERRSFALLQACGLTLDPTTEPTIRQTPTDFERRFPATGGALYGQTMHGWMATFRRPASVTRVPGLFVAGGSTHPGAGVPMATLSGRLAAEATTAFLASTRRSYRAATSGGTSTPSATTVGTA